MILKQQTSSITEKVCRCRISGGFLRQHRQLRQHQVQGITEGILAAFTLAFVYCLK